MAEKEIATEEIKKNIITKYDGLICDECKKKTTEMLKKRGKLALLTPKKTSVMLANAICKKCRMKILRKSGR